MCSTAVDLACWAQLKHHNTLPPQCRRPVNTSCHLDVTRQRPRTVSASFRPYSSCVSRTSSRSQTRAATTLGTSHGRVQQVSHEPTRRHNLQSHLATKKSPQPPWQKSLESELVPWVVAPGYILSKSKSKVDMYIKMQEFFGDDTQKEKLLDGTKDDMEIAAKNSLLADLQAQVDNLTVYLEEERISHKETRNKAAEELQERTKNLEKEHKETIRRLKAEHEASLSALEKKDADEMASSKTNMDDAIAKARKDADFIRMTFDTYKRQLEQETEERERTARERLQSEHSAELQSKMKQLQSTMSAEMNEMKAQMTRDLQNETSRLKKEHRRETEALVRKFSNAIEDGKKLDKAEQRIEEMKLEADTMKSDYDRVCLQMSEVTRNLTDTKMEFAKLQHSFQEQIRLVADQFKGEIDEMRIQNTELRRLYVTKCNELFEEQAEKESTQVEQLRNAKETMKLLIRTRERAGINIASTCPEDDPPEQKTRPGSAPITRPETRVARCTAAQTGPMLPVDEGSCEEVIKEKVMVKTVGVRRDLLEGM